MTQTFGAERSTSPAARGGAWPEGVCGTAAVVAETGRLGWPSHGPGFAGPVDSAGGCAGSGGLRAALRLSGASRARLTWRRRSAGRRSAACSGRVPRSPARCGIRLGIRCAASGAGSPAMVGDAAVADISGCLERGSGPLWRRACVPFAGGDCGGHVVVAASRRGGLDEERASEIGISRDRESRSLPASVNAGGAWPSAAVRWSSHWPISSASWRAWPFSAQGRVSSVVRVRASRPARDTFRTAGGWARTGLMASALASRSPFSRQAVARSIRTPSI